MIFIAKNFFVKMPTVTCFAADFISEQFQFRLIWISRFELWSWPLNNTILHTHEDQNPNVLIKLFNGRLYKLRRRGNILGSGVFAASCIGLQYWSDCKARRQKSL
jgi:hypothetical protein